jgi:hypothetical protein
VKHSLEILPFHLAFSISSVPVKHSGPIENLEKIAIGGGASRILRRPRPCISGQAGRTPGSPDCEDRG